MKKALKTFALVVIAALASIVASGQKRTETLACRQEVFERLQPLPKLSYECRPEAADDYDEAILKWPERLRAIREYMARLAAFSSGRNWWETSVEEMNVCYARGSAGAMDEEEAERFRRGDYPLNLFGNSRIRLVVTSDPCYQTGYGGSNAFLLYRRGERTIVTQMLNGHFSRADNSIGFDFGMLNRRQLIEVSTTTGGLNPYITNYYFVVDNATGRAFPARIFKDGKRLTSEITSVLILDDGTFPKGFEEMRIIKGGTLARRFYAYEDTGGQGGITDASGRSLRRRVYVWNGRYYETRQRKE
ncbi:MAG TPA: hypothetical protein VJS44_03865 [Pyrinomonadaceae bacterium]|nr:hypothetical protein [Pyrinomonadaceae bacterium]